MKSRRHHFVLGVAEDALQVGLARLLHRRADFLVAGLLHGLHRQVDDRHRRRRHAERHAGQLALDLGDHQADRLGRAGGRRDDVDAPRVRPPFQSFLRGPSTVFCVAV